MQFVVIGAGDVGLTLCAKLVAEQHDVVLIERDEDKLLRVAGSLDVQVVAGNGCQPEILAQAGLNDADYLVAVADVDEVNLTACTVSRLINPKVKRIARIRDLNLKHISIDQSEVRKNFDLLVNPDVAGADHLVQLFRVPGATEVFEFADGRLRVIGVVVSPGASIINRPLSKVRELEGGFPFLLIAIVRANKLIVPHGGDRIRAGDMIYAISEPSDTAQLFTLAGRVSHEGRSAFIWGGSGIARHFAHALEGNGTSVKLLVGDMTAAMELADELTETLVLHGDGTDQNLLMEENISDVDAFIAASNEEEDNILAALLAKRLGARTVMALVNKSAYLPLVSSVGVDVVVSSRVAAANAIFNHIHSEYVVAGFSLRNQGAGFIELTAAQEMGFVDAPIKDSKLPSGILITAIVRNGQVIIPTGDDIIAAGDRLVIFVTQLALKKLEKLVNLKLELLS